MASLNRSLLRGPLTIDFCKLASQAVLQVLLAQPNLDAGQGNARPAGDVFAACFRDTSVLVPLYRPARNELA
jgi:hypothetical protein